jgi:hypothetical protein
MRSIIVLVLVSFICGCASTGPVIGPLSYAAAKSNEKNEISRFKRKVMLSSEIPVDSKDKIFEAVNLGATPDEVAVGIQMDLAAFSRDEAPMGDKLKMGVAQLADGGIWALLGKVIIDAASDSGNKSDNNSQADAIQIENISGNGNSINIVNGNENTSNNDDNPRDEANTTVTGDSNLDTDLKN